MIPKRIMAMGLMRGMGIWDLCLYEQGNFFWFLIYFLLKDWMSFYRQQGGTFNDLFSSIFLYLPVCMNGSQWLSTFISPSFMQSM
ncbi:hypothetical protein EYC84_004183 [Monilinia fructicola]|uniref:Uncharacterized protein n=1 Tax=Monilinia fructicola TaxID=38448 RepID=A0A5M9K0A8_MONFR|nr:hypothetical protein EYC84_004183 [Monilinia fructicola]